MNTVTLPATLNVALLAELHPTTRRPDRVHAVLAWTEHGERIYQPLVTPTLAAFDPRPQLPFDFDPGGPVEQLRLDLGGVDTPRSCSSGLTWRTWALPSIPAGLRHLSPGGLVRELARRLGG